MHSLAQLQDHRYHHLYYLFIQHGVCLRACLLFTLAVHIYAIIYHPEQTDTVEHSTP